MAEIKAIKEIPAGAGDYNAQNYNSGGPVAKASTAELALVLGHCPTPATQGSSDQLSAIAEQGTLSPTSTEDDPSSFEFAEHRYLGDSLRLQGLDSGNPNDKSAKWNPITLDNGLVVTYGQICGLAADFFAFQDPIATSADPKATFRLAFEGMAKGDSNKKMAEELLAVLQAEVDAVEAALKKGGDEVAKAYAKLSDDNATFNIITKKFKATPLTYFELAQRNLDHFAPWSRTAYNAAHSVALLEASKGTPDNLKRAYAMNAFADHFLEDSFSSGHFRVPRDQLMNGKLVNALAKLMHDEDSRLGIFVRDKARQKSWTAFGDKHLFDNADATNREQLFLALKASVDEIHQAFTTRTVVPEADFKAWNHTPSIESMASKDSNPAPLLLMVNGELCHRKSWSVDISATKREDLVKPDQWSGYVKVGNSDDLPFLVKFTPMPAATREILSTAYFAYTVSPPGTTKTLIKTVLIDTFPALKDVINLLFG